MISENGWNEMSELRRRSSNRENPGLAFDLAADEAAREDVLLVSGYASG
jgi:hypothetical protein